jgi:shikimate dehydrogenase
LRQFGLIGFSLQHSFSKQFFSDKFGRKNNTDCVYENFELKTIDEFPKLLTTNTNLAGLNVTLPYKQRIIKFLDSLDDEARDIGAVNVIKFEKGVDGKNKLIGYNSDHYGFAKSLKEILPKGTISSLILGVGGGSKAVAYALKKMNIPFKIVSRKPNEGELSFDKVSNEIINTHHLIINTTPLGMSPNVKSFPPLPYGQLTEKHILFDLAYNPDETVFLKKGKEKGATTLNGLKMLHYQAERSWKIWNR